jgi:hypothetical protein
MSGWIIGIDGNRPQNWEIAKDNLVWATKKRFPVASGDDLFFWKTGGGGLIAYAVATEDARPVTVLEGVPWPDHNEQHYVSRFDLTEIVESTSAVTNSWTTLQEWGEFSGMANQGVVRIDSLGGVERLRQLVAERASADIPPMIRRQVEEARGALTSPEDARQFVQRSIAERRGQPQFRRSLIRAYDGRCCVTECDAVPALEAAHIAPYRGAHTHHVRNGLLLRADIHTLFDLLEMTVDASTREIHLSDSLRRTRYEQLHGTALRPPNSPNAMPAAEVLALHNQAFRMKHGAP